MAIPLTEDIHSLRNATKLLPPRRGDRPVHASCMFRWAKFGLRNVKLETIRIGGTLCTSRQALERFFARLAELDNPGESPARRSQEIAEAARKAEETLR